MRRIRRAALASEITAEVGLADQQPVWDIVNRFRSDGRTFLVVYTGPGSASAEGDARIDISHESLIRRWDKLAHWVEEEAESADKYRWIAGEAQRAARGPWPLLRDRALDEADAWWDRQRPNAAWGKRYCPAVDFRDVEKFLERSRSERDRITAEQEPATAGRRSKAGGAGATPDRARARARGRAREDAGAGARPRAGARASGATGRGQRSHAGTLREACRRPEEVGSCSAPVFGRHAGIRGRGTPVVQESRARLAISNRPTGCTFRRSSKRGVSFGRGRNMRCCWPYRR